MNKENQKIENFLKQRVESVKPSTAFFDRTIENVTNIKENRNTSKREHYNFINIFSMKKFLVVGLPVAALALVMILTLDKSQESKVVINEENADIYKETEKKTNNNSGTVSSNDSVDKIIDEIFADFGTEVALASNESEEETEMYGQLDAFNNLATTQYENNI